MASPMNRNPDPNSNRFHGRVSGSPHRCAAAGCDQPGEFRAPGDRHPNFDGPGSYQWFCLEHVRAFNAAYDRFAGMTAEQIMAEQSPIAGWQNASRAFTANGGIDAPPRWADFRDPLEAISGRAKAAMPAQRADGQIITAAERKALGLLGLAVDADRAALRRAYTQKLRRFHPDHNGGDRSFEAKLLQVVEAYKALRASRLFN